MIKKVAKVEWLRRGRFNSIWLIPLVALVVAAWMLYQNWSSQGPTIEIVAANAEGLEVGRTKVKARNVDVGEVTNIRLSSDYNQAIITVLLHSGSREMLHEDAKFWVIKPRVGREGVSGLGTLLSGAYIDMEPGTKGPLTDHFDMLPQPPLSTSQDEGIRIRLSSRNIAKMSVGTPVHFRGYDVGYIEKVGFDLKNGDITYRLFIHAPYDSLVTSAVQFWLTPGLSVKSSARGFEFRMDSLETLMSGGISFGQTKNDEAGHPVSDFTHFRLFASKEEAENNRYDQFIHYVFLFNSNISGLEVGAPVQYRGIRIGTVEQVPLRGVSFKRWGEQKNPAIPVLARIEPQRLNTEFNSEHVSMKMWEDTIDKSIRNGLRATLSTSSFLTGAKVINMDFLAKPVKSFPMTTMVGYPTFPTVGSGVDQLEQKVNKILDQVAKIPFKQTALQLQQTLAQADNAMASMKKTSDSIGQFLQRSDTQQLPKQAQQAITEFNQTLQLYQKNGVVGQQVQSNLDTLQRTLNDLQPLVRQLRQQPSSLIFDRKLPADRQPKAAISNRREP
ncbi:intermembrane transport protein PqiB [Celerinatantimonas sp. YJH-8]|uniref:intermembrane transport protein PqiB n=1 Tax=Celerinatantimonas sp. YJH-8 TaxID=3228714 RepID=UPI0038CB3ABB